MTNQLAEQTPIIEMTLSLRDQLFDSLSDDDLKFALPHNQTLGALCRELGEWQQMYIDSFKSFKMEYTYSYPDADKVETDLAALRAWSNDLNAALMETLSGLSDEEVMRPIDRGNNFMLPAMMQVHIFREAILIFCGKVSIYLRAMEKDLPGLWPTWIG